MQVFKQDKKGWSSFLNKLKQSYELIAPVKNDVVRFVPIENVNDIYLKERSYFPAKEYFFKKEDVLFKFDKNRITVPAFKQKKRAFFGLRRCDLNAIKHQDIAFGKVNDTYYENSRKNNILLGYHCNTSPSPFCFCGSLNLVDFFDLMFYDKESYFLVEIGSETGENIVKKYEKFFSKTDEIISEENKKIPNTDRLNKKDISKLYDNAGWKKGVDMCLSCSACTTLCPTCYCFSIYDVLSSKNPKKGERKRFWSSCQLQGFTRIAGDYYFRKNRDQRFKHRIYHQLQYFKERNGVNLCVGCGRCIEGCPTRIDFVRIINEMKE